MLVVLLSIALLLQGLWVTAQPPLADCCPASHPGQSHPSPPSATTTGNCPACSFGLALLPEALRLPAIAAVAALAAPSPSSSIPTARADIWRPPITAFA